MLSSIVRFQKTGRPCSGNPAGAAADATSDRTSSPALDVPVEVVAADATAMHA
jgi:hypothetical protein